MDIEPALRSELINNAAVAAMVGTRVYPMHLPQGYTLPAISYQMISAPRAWSTTGPVGQVQARVQVDCWAETYDGAKSLSNGVRLALDNFRGTLGTGDEAMDNVGTISMVAYRDGFNTTTENYGVILEFYVPYFESTT